MTDSSVSAPSGAPTRVLVLGATGYVGRNTLAALRRAPNAEVIVGCRDASRLGPSVGDCEVRVGDLRDPHYRSRVFRGVDVVCFANAWSALYGRAKQSRADFLQPTLEGMTAAANAGVRRILFTSAIDVVNVARSRSASVRRDVAKVWPHLGNVILIEQHMKALAARGLTTAAMRCGAFTGPGGTLGILPVLLPRLRARMVPYIEGGQIPMRLIDGRDVGEAFRVAALAPLEAGAHHFDVARDDSPSFLQLLRLIHAQFGVPLPWFSVSFDMAYGFAAFAEALSHLTPFDPLLTRSIIFLSEPAPVNTEPLKALGFRPAYAWQDSVREQVAEILDKRIPSRLITTSTRMLPAPR